MNKNLLIMTLSLLFSKLVYANLYEMKLYGNIPLPQDQIEGFFDNHKSIASCSVDVDATSVYPHAFIPVNSDAFRSFTCTLAGSNSTYAFSYGAEAVNDNFIGASEGFGLLFDENAEPLRFDSANVFFSDANSFGLWDTEVPGNWGDTVHSSLTLAVRDSDNVRWTPFMRPFGV